MPPSSWTFISTVLSLLSKVTLGEAVTVAAVSYILWKNFVDPLRSIPGFWLNRYTAIHRMLENVLISTQHKRLLAEVRKYGPIWRIGPDAVAVADIDAIKIVLQTMDFPKMRFYKRLRFIPNQDSVFSTTDKGWHKNRRRLLSKAFAWKCLRSMEPQFCTCAQNLVEAWRSLATNNGGEVIVDLNKDLKNYATDLIGLTAFGQDFGLVKTGKSEFIHLVDKSFFLSAMISPFPFLGYLLEPIVSKTRNAVTKVANDVIQKRRVAKEKPNDILQLLLDAEIEDDSDTKKIQRLSDVDILIETVTFLLAGSETTGNSMTWLFKLLMEYPDVYKRLVDDVDKYLPHVDNCHPAGVEESKNIPFLSAVINEAIRLHPASGTAIPREVPDGGVNLMGHFIPEKTVVAVPIYGLQRWEQVWGPDAEEFTPERWLRPDAEKYRDYLVAFSAGSRNCIGKDFALQEMHHLIATLIRTFDFKPVTDPKVAEQKSRVYLTLGIRGEFNVKIRPRN